MNDLINFIVLLLIVLLFTFPAMIAFEAAYFAIRKKRLSRPRHVHDCIHRVDD